MQCIIQIGSLIRGKIAGRDIIGTVSEIWIWTIDYNIVISCCMLLLMKNCESRWRLYRRSLYCSCNFWANLKLYQKKKKLPKQDKRRMLRMLGQKCPPFWCIWTRKHLGTRAPGSCPPTPCGPKKALCMKEWKDRQKLGPEGHYWIANQSALQPLPPANLPRVATDAVEVGVLFVF